MNRQLSALFLEANKRICTRKCTKSFTREAIGIVTSSTETSYTMDRKRAILIANVCVQFFTASYFNKRIVILIARKVAVSHYRDVHICIVVHAVARLDLNSVIIIAGYCMKLIVRTARTDSVVFIPHSTIF